MAPDCIQSLINVGESDANIAMLGPMIYHHSEPDVIQSAGGLLGRFWQTHHLGFNEVDRGQFMSPHEVDWLSGCALLVRRAVIERIGKFDDRLFMYWEEVDWCLRTRQYGWRLVHVPSAKIWHKGVRRGYQPLPMVTYYSTRNQFLVLRKHHAPLKVKLVRWIQTLRILLSWTFRPKWREMHNHRDAMWQGICDFVFQRWGMRQMQGK